MGWRSLPRALYALLLSAGIACSPAPLKPEAALPTSDQIWQLASLPIQNSQAAKDSYKPKFELKVFPSVVLAGNAAWITCYVPEYYGAGQIRMGLEPLHMSERPLDRIEHKRLIERVECGTWVVSCTVRTWVRHERREAKLEARGSCNSGEGEQ